MNKEKFNLRYRFLFRHDKDNAEKFIEIKYPFRLDFLIQRGSMTNTANFVIYGLSEENADIMQQSYVDMDIWKNAICELGYHNNLSLRFVGNVKEAYTIKSDVDIQTIINCNVDGFAMQNGFANITVNAGTTHLEVVNKLVELLGYEVSILDKDYLKKQVLLQSTTFAGRPLDLLKNFLGTNLSTDLQKLTIKEQILSMQSDKIAYDTTKVFLINEASGLKDSPKRMQGFIELEMILEPTINLGDVVFISSKFAGKLDGYYKVLEIVETGTITAMGDSNGCTTKLKLMKFNGSLI
jgi:hypothetical protein